LPLENAIVSSPTVLTSYPLQLDLPAGSLSLSLPPETVRDIQTALAQITEALKAVALQTSSTERGNRPRPQRPIEYQHTGQVFLEIFCNPNIWPTPFAAKILLSVRDDRLRISSEIELVRLNECIDRYFEQIPD
jgi:hypothetical protein